MYEHGTEIKDIENGRIGEIVKILLYKGSFTSYQTNKMDQTYYMAYGIYSRIRNAIFKY